MTPKEKFDIRKEQNHRISRQIVNGIVNGSKTIEYYMDLYDLSKQRIMQIAYFELKRISKINLEYEINKINNKTK